MNLEKICYNNGLKLTEQRKVVAQVLEKATDHPLVEEVHQRAKEIDPKISLATVYRTMKFFEEAGLVKKHDFGDGKARYEISTNIHHDHLINLNTGEVIEFHDEELEKLKDKISRKLGYKLVSHRLELYAVPIDNNKDE